jgi:hypothetical protein
MSHPADKWIVSLWLGKTVQQISTGLTCKVLEGVHDASGALRCRTEMGWIPAIDLRIKESNAIVP